MDDSKQKTTIDELDIDELIEETKDLLDDEDSSEQEKKDTSQEKSETKQEDKKKRKIPVLYITWILLVIIILLLAFLCFKEYRKKPKINTGFFTINKKIVFISQKKRLAEKLKNEIKKYDFKLLIAYKFASVSGIKIIKAVIKTKFYTKADVPLDKLYSLIKDKVYSDFKELTKGKYIEDIKNNRNIIADIIKKDTLKIICETIPGINKELVKKNLKFGDFLIF